MMEKHLVKAYYSPTSPGALGGVERLYQQVKGHGINRKQVEQWLATQLAYTDLRQVKRKFSRNHVLAFHKNDQWQVDLADVRDLARKNNNIKYILVGVDILTRKAFVHPLKNKTGVCVRDGLKSMIGKHRVNRIQTDFGKEFYNQTVSKFFKQRNIKHFSSQNFDIKAGICERYIRTLRGKMARYMVGYNTKRYIDHLQSFARSYNRSVHRTTGMAPNKIRSKKDEKEVFRRLYGPPGNPPWKKTRFQIGDTVKILKPPRVFLRGSKHSQWSEEIFTIAEVIRQTYQQRPQYILVDANNEPIIGRFYADELQLAIV